MNSHPRLKERGDSLYEKFPRTKTFKSRNLQTSKLENLKKYPAPENHRENEKIKNSNENINAHETENTSDASDEDNYDYYYDDYCNEEESLEDTCVSEVTANEVQKRVPKDVAECDEEDDNFDCQYDEDEEQESEVTPLQLLQSFLAEEEKNENTNNSNNNSNNNNNNHLSANASSLEKKEKRAKQLSEIGDATKWNIDRNSFSPFRNRILNLSLPIGPNDDLRSERTSPPISPTSYNHSSESIIPPFLQSKSSPIITTPKTANIMLTPSPIATPVTAQTIYFPFQYFHKSPRSSNNNNIEDSLHHLPERNIEPNLNSSTTTLPSIQSINNNNNNNNHHHHIGVSSVNSNHPNPSIKQILSYLGNPQHELQKYMPWVEAANKSGSYPLIHSLSQKFSPSLVPSFQLKFEKSSPKLRDSLRRSKDDLDEDISYVNKQVKIKIVNDDVNSNIKTCVDDNSVTRRAPRKKKPILYQSLRLSSLGEPKGRRWDQLKQIGYRHLILKDVNLKYENPHIPQPQSPLLLLPDELILKIIWFLLDDEEGNSAKPSVILGINSIGRVCKQLYCLCNSSTVWRLLCSFTPSFPLSNKRGVAPYKDWKRLYREWTSVSISKITITSDYYVDERNILAYEGEWRGAHYLVVNCPSRKVNLNLTQLCLKMHNRYLGRVFDYYFGDNDGAQVACEHVGYNYLWGREWLNFVKLFPPSERNIQIIIKQISIAVKNIYEKIWPVAYAHNLILFTVCPSFIYFDSSMKNVKLSFWWYDVLSPDFVNPDPAKYFFVAPEVIVADKLNLTNCTDLWCLGVLLYALLSLDFPFGSLNTSMFGILVNILNDEVPPMTGPIWDDVSDDAKNLIRRLLEKNPEERISIQDVLNHPFLSEPKSTTPLEAYKCLEDTKVYQYIESRLPNIKDKKVSEI